MSTYISIYGGSPTAGQTDGNAISEGSFQNPISFALNSTKEETSCLRLAVRCREGYEANGAVSIYVEHKKDDGTYELTGGNIDKYALCQDEGFADSDAALKNGKFSSKLELAGVSDTNTVFWLKCTSKKTEEPETDKTCSLHAEGIVRAKA